VHDQVTRRPSGMDGCRWIFSTVSLTRRSCCDGCAVILCVSVLMSLVRPGPVVYCCPPPVYSHRRCGPIPTGAASTAGRRRSITTCPRRGEAGRRSLPAVPCSNRRSPGPGVSRACRRSAPFVRRATSGLHSLCWSLIQSRLEFSPASSGIDVARSTGIVHARRTSCEVLGGLIPLSDTGLACHVCFILDKQSTTREGQQFNNDCSYSYISDLLHCVAFLAQKKQEAKLSLG